jgi:hypothetical protein
VPEDFLTRHQRSILATLVKNGKLEKFHLGGGAGLAYHLGHRRTHDLDFFTDKALDASEIIEALSKRSRVRVVRQAEHTLTLRVGGARVSFFVHRWKPVHKPSIMTAGIKVANMADIAAMKLTALAGRGARKDFIDLYLVCRSGVSLDRILNTLARRYRGVTYDLYHILHSLVYFEDAEKEQMPDMLVKIDWKDVKYFFLKEAKRLFAEKMR